MNDSYDNSFVSDIHRPDFSSTAPAHFCSFPRQHGPFGQVLYAPISHFNHSSSTPSIANDDANSPAFESRLPLHPQPSGYSDFQSVAATTGPTGSVVPLLQTATGTQELTHTDFSFAPSLKRQNILKEEVSALRLQDICHVESTSSSASDLGYPPLADVGDGLDLFDLASNSNPTSDTAYSECPSVDFLAPVYSLPSSLPPLSYDSLSLAGSGSESNLLETPMKMSVSSFLSLSALDFPSACKVEDDDSGFNSPLGIYADVNLREQAWQKADNLSCVNPADVMTDSLRLWAPSSWEESASPSPQPDAISCSPLQSPAPLLSIVIDSSPSATTPQSIALSPTPEYIVEFPNEALIDQVFPQEAVSAIVSVLKASNVKQEVQQSSDLALPPQSFLKLPEVIAPQPLYPAKSQGYSGNDLGILYPIQADSITGDPCSSSSSSQPARRVPFAELRLPQLQYTTPPYTYTATAQFSHTNVYTFAQPQTVSSQSVEPPSPVLNAHLGVPLEDLRRRAADYRQRSRGADLDKSFLQCFAGRLSERGELQDEYRCYVVDCGQRNKRRDHILVHVGSHVEHRPWSCRHCGMRFLRKNECKRHESSHEGLKPFSCYICAPSENKSFVRQDLLKRHLRVSHGVQDTNGRRKSQAKKENDAAEYWP